MQIKLELPDELAASLSADGGDPARAALELLVAETYRVKRLTMEQVRRLLGYGTRMQVDQFLQQHEIYDYTLADLEQDRQTLARLEKKTQAHPPA